MFKKEIYQQRRAKLKSALGSGKILFLGNEYSSINYKDNYYRFRQDSTFLYYFGISEPGLAAIINIDEDEEVIFGDELSIEDVIWTGPLPTLAGRAKKVGIDTVVPSTELELHTDSQILYLPPYRGEHILQLAQLTGKSINQIEGGYSLELIKTISDQRVLKSEEELLQMHEACAFSGEMHKVLMRAAHPGMKEHHIVALIEKCAMDHDVATAYTPICTINGQTLHNHHYHNTLEEGKLMLVDAGLESSMCYAGDLTRTFPVSKKFTSKQKGVYEVVYDSFMRAVALAKPGILFRDLHLRTSEKIAEGLIGIGLMKGDPVEAVANGAHTLFFPHGLGHLIGLDVHDMENFGEEYIGYTPEVKKSKEFGLKSLRLGKSLQPGYTVTIEPGIYFIPELIDKRRSEKMYTDFVNYEKLEEFRSLGGIRLEDNFVIREDGAELLGIPLARTSSEIEEQRYAAFS